MAERLMTGDADCSGTFVAPRRFAMSELTLTDRQLRERRYYDEFVQRTSPDVASLDALSGSERRPWNPYWFVTELLQDSFRAPTQQLLDVGCGPGSYAVQLAHLGYEVSGFDISPGNIEAADALARRYGVEERTHFSVGAAEHLGYPSGHFDVVVGIDILHHVDIVPTIGECLRVLKRGGFAVFKEPIEVPLFDWLRNTSVGRALAPKDASFEHHITEDERKLTARDLAAIRHACAVEEHRFRVCSRLEALIGHRFQTPTGASRLEIFDRALIGACPPLGAFGGNVVLVCRHAN